MGAPGRVRVHNVVLKRADVQPSEDHVTFVSGNVDADLKVEVPNECLYLPIASWMGLGCPQEITCSVLAGNVLEHLRPKS